MSPLARLFTAPLLLLSSALHAQTPSDAYLGHIELEHSTLIVSEAVNDLDVPWDIESESDGTIWFTQHAGSIHRFHQDSGKIETVLQNIPDLYWRKSLGLLGIALHPDFQDKPFVFIHYTTQSTLADFSEIIESKLVRYRFDGSHLVEPQTLLEHIPGKSYHNGSRIAIGPDLKLYLTTGDAGNPPSSLDPKILSGKILRLNLDGSIPADNPIANSPVWTLGHRNPQGLAFSTSGKLFASEHGPNNDDEVNLIRKGANYGWPRIEGFADRDDEIATNRELQITEPLRAWTPTIAAAGLDVYESPQIPEWQNALVLASLKGRALRILPLDKKGENIESGHIYFQKRFGRLRDVHVAPSGDIYFSTSNLDWHPRYQPWMYDQLPQVRDRILRIHKATPEDLAFIASLEQPTLIVEDPEPINLSSEDWSFAVSDVQYSQGEQLYLQHCMACHNPNGTGAPGLLPPLAGTDWVTGDKGRLIRLVLNGMSGPIEVNGTTYDQEMPSFAHLSDEQLASILSYIRTSFGNQANGVIAGEVADERAALSNR